MLGILVALLFFLILAVFYLGLWFKKQSFAGSDLSILMRETEWERWNHH